MFVLKKKASAKKITARPEDSITDLVGKIKKIAADEVLIEVPRDAKLGRSLDSFQALKRLAEGLGKTVSVESVDDHILELAGIAGLKSQNPIFKVRPRPVYDIVPRRRRAGRRLAVTGMIGDAGDYEAKSAGQETPVKTSGRETRDSGGKPNGETSGALRYLPWFALALSVALLAYALAVKILPRATVEIIMKEYLEPVSAKVVVSPDTPEVTLGDGVIKIPGEVFTAEDEIRLSFPASGRETVSDKARGTITVYNNYDSAPQTLVARTRFRTPDGKIFRTEEAITVPGAKVSGGKVEPSSVAVRVSADEPGVAYNIGPVAKWVIPGFEGGPRFNGFYGVSNSPMAGGFTGERAVATDDDLKKAKEQAREAILKSLKNKISVVITQEMEVLDGSTLFAVKTEEITGPTADDPNFTIATAAELKQLVFHSADLKNELVREAGESQALNPENQYGVSGYDVLLEKITPDGAGSSITFTATGAVKFKTALDTAAVQESLLGKTSAEIKQIIYDLPGLESAHVSLWPFWVHRAPAEKSKVRIVVQ